MSIQNNSVSTETFEPTITMKASLAQAVLDYLQTRPYVEVYLMIDAMRVLEANKPEEVEPPENLASAAKWPSRIAQVKNITPTPDAEMDKA